MDVKLQLLNKIKEYQTIIIHGHIRPDGDCYGAQFGLKNIISLTFPTKKVFVVGQESQYLSFIGKPDQIDDKVYQNALSIVVDTATKDRISDQRYKLGKEIFKIDHHLPSEDSNYGKYNWIETEKPSASQMIAEFYDLFKQELILDYDGALPLYVGITTDTGGFRYRGVSRKTHEMAGLLLDFGVDVEFVDKKLSLISLNQVKLKGYVLSNFLETKNGFVYFILTKEIREKFNLTQEQSSAMVNNLAGIEGYPVWALFIEADDQIRVRLRSNGPEIESIARKYHGGGHEKAAGATLFNLEEINDLIKDVDDHIKRYKEKTYGIY